MRVKATNNMAATSSPAATHSTVDRPLRGLEVDAAACGSEALGRNAGGSDWVTGTLVWREDALAAASLSPFSPSSTRRSTALTKCSASSRADWKRCR
jgi:hypothetical protein